MIRKKKIVKKKSYQLKAKGETLRKAARDWNKEFQTLKALEDGLEKYTKMSQLAHDFVYCART